MLTQKRERRRGQGGETTSALQRALAVGTEAEGLRRKQEAAPEGVVTGQRPQGGRGVWLCAQAGSFKG